MIIPQAGEFMASAADIAWFKGCFAPEIVKAVAGTPFDADMLTAIACQESGEIWGRLRHTALKSAEIAALCCGDTLDDTAGRRAFPRNRAALLAAPKGAEMFAIARRALLAMAAHDPGYGFAFRKPHKFAHGFGIFQCDLQHFKTDPSYFLERRYERFGETLWRALRELDRGLKALGFDGAPISDAEFCQVAICYNTGSYVPRRGLRQGHRSGGKYYGEWIAHYLALSRATAHSLSVQAL